MGQRWGFQLTFGGRWGEERHTATIRMRLRETKLVRGCPNPSDWLPSTRPPIGGSGSRGDPAASRDFGSANHPTGSYWVSTYAGTRSDLPFSSNSRRSHPDVFRPAA